MSLPYRQGIKPRGSLGRTTVIVCCNIIAQPLAGCKRSDMIFVKYYESIAMLSSLPAVKPKKAEGVRLWTAFQSIFSSGSHVKNRNLLDRTAYYGYRRRANSPGPIHTKEYAMNIYRNTGCSNSYCPATVQFLSGLRRQYMWFLRRQQLWREQLRQHELSVYPRLPRHHYCGQYHYRRTRCRSQRYQQRH